MKISPGKTTCGGSDDDYACGNPSILCWVFVSDMEVGEAPVSPEPDLPEPDYQVPQQLQFSPKV